MKPTVTLSLERFRELEKLEKMMKEERYLCISIHSYSGLYGAPSTSIERTYKIKDEVINELQKIHEVELSEITDRVRVLNEEGESLRSRTIKETLDKASGNIFDMDKGTIKSLYYLTGDAIKAMLMTC